MLQSADDVREMSMPNFIYNECKVYVDMDEVFEKDISVPRIRNTDSKEEEGMERAEGDEVMPFYLAWE